MKSKLLNYLYIIIKFFVRVFYPVISVKGTENLPEEACIIVSNHAKMNGPIACELYFPGEHYTWTAGEMMHMKEVPDYSYKDFWSSKPRYSRWFYRLLSYMIAPFSACIFNNANCIGVYHDMRILSTFRETVDKLKNGANVIIFPEHDVPYNNIVWEFQDRFIDVAKMYYKKTGREPLFVPMYVAPKMKTLYIGEPVRFDHNAEPREERRRICTAMMDRITALATGLPEHTVVPYPNMSRNEYPKSTEVLNAC